MEKIVIIGDREVRMRVSARIPFDYRNLFGKDIITEMQKMQDGNGINYELFDNLAWLMAKYAGEEVHAELPAREAVAEWLDGFDNVLAIISAAPEIMELWNSGTNTLSIARKN